MMITTIMSDDLEGLLLTAKALGDSEPTPTEHAARRLICALLICEMERTGESSHELLQRALLHARKLKWSS